MMLITRRVATGLLLSGAGSGVFAQSRREVRIAIGASGFGTAPARLARELGLFEKHGLEPRLSVMDSGNTAEAAIISRSADLCLAGPGEIVPAVARGQPVVIITNSYSGFSVSLVLAKLVADRLGVAPTAPVMDRIRALDGLVIAAPSPTSSSTYAYKTLTKLGGASVRLTYMDLPAMPAALESGAVQGFLSSAPFWAFPVVRGTGVLWISGPRGDVPLQYRPVSSSSVQAMRNVATSDPVLIGRVRAVFADFVETLGQRPREVREALNKLYPNIDAATLDLLFEAESPAWNAKPLTTEDIAHEIAFIADSGVSLPNISSIDPAQFLLPAQ